VANLGLASLMECGYPFHMADVYPMVVQTDLKPSKLGSVELLIVRFHTLCHVIENRFAGQIERLNNQHRMWKLIL
jgi:hypothetical protein